MPNAPDVYEWTGPTGVRFRDVREPSGTYYHDTTPRAVIDALENAYRLGQRVRLWFGDRATGCNWYDEFDVVGKVGRSMGPICIPLLIHNRRSIGGGAILCDCIVRMMADGREVYRHPKFRMGAFTIRSIRRNSKLGKKGYTHGVDIDGHSHANFRSLQQAQRWIGFMTGERMSK